MLFVVLGRKIAALRNEHGLSQVALAERLQGVSRSYIATLESPRRPEHDAPSLEVVLKLALFFGVSLDYLLREDVPLRESTGSALHQAAQGPPPQNFGPRLRSLRLANGLSQGQLAERIGLISQAYISNLERKRQAFPSIEVAIRLADLFDITLDELLLSKVKE
jgi:transcriptional regulator with XRE-family HTH domain